MRQTATSSPSPSLSPLDATHCAICMGGQPYVDSVWMATRVNGRGIVHPTIDRAAFPLKIQKSLSILPPLLISFHLIYVLRAPIDIDGGAEGSLLRRRVVKGVVRDIREQVSLPLFVVPASSHRKVPKNNKKNQSKKKSSSPNLSHN